MYVIVSVCVYVCMYICVCVEACICAYILVRVSVCDFNGERINLQLDVLNILPFSILSLDLTLKSAGNWRPKTLGFV